MGRIEQVNGSLNAAVAFRAHEALEEADKADAIIKAGKLNPKETPFLGVPCSIKVRILSYSTNRYLLLIPFDIF